MNRKHYTTPAVVAIEIEEQSLLATSPGNVVVDTTTEADEGDVLSGSFDGVEFDWDKEAWQ